MPYSSLTIAIAIAIASTQARGCKTHTHCLGAQLVDGSQLVVGGVHAGEEVFAVLVALHHLGLRHDEAHHVVEHPAFVNLQSASQPVNHRV